MEKLKILAVLVCLVILVIAGSYFVNHAYLPPEDHRQDQRQDTGHTLQPTLQPAHQSTSVIPTQIQRMCSGYVIDEVKPDSFMHPTMIVNVTRNELADFPAIERDLQNATKIPAGDRYGPNITDWYNGHRLVGTFDNDTQYYEFRNLSCKHSPDPTCNPLNFTQEFEYMGRYYEMLCYPSLPSFAGAHDKILSPT